MPNILALASSCIFLCLLSGGISHGSCIVHFNICKFLLTRPGIGAPRGESGLSHLATPTRRHPPCHVDLRVSSCTTTCLVRSFGPFESQMPLARIIFADARA